MNFIVVSRFNGSSPLTVQYSHSFIQSFTESRDYSKKNKKKKRWVDLCSMFAMIVISVDRCLIEKSRIIFYFVCCTWFEIYTHTHIFIRRVENNKEWNSQETTTFNNKKVTPLMFHTQTFLDFLLNYFYHYRHHH